MQVVIPNPTIAVILLSLSLGFQTVPRSKCVFWHRLLLPNLLILCLGMFTPHLLFEQSSSSGLNDFALPLTTYDF